MPIYEYRCESCQEAFQTLVLSGQAKPQCPSCGSKKVAKLFSTFAAHNNSGPRPCDDAPCPTAGSCRSGGCPFSA